MNNIIIKSPWIVGKLSLRPGSVVQISIVAYEHSAGLPARFCAGLIPAIYLSRQIKLNGLASIIRVIDPTPIANYCNGWQKIEQSQFRDVATRFLEQNSVDFFFDEAEQICDDSIEILSALGAELDSCTDGKVIDIVQRIKESGRRHGGEAGARNATLYMAAHPFSWLDMYHPLVWKKSYPSENFQFINLMSKPEERFTVVRKFLQERRPDLCAINNPIDRYMTICNTPCYIPLEEEPMLSDLVNYGHNWCYKRYCELKSKSSNHNRALKDFKTLMSFLGQNSA